MNPTERRCQECRQKVSRNEWRHMKQRQDYTCWKCIAAFYTTRRWLQANGLDGIG